MNQQQLNALQLHAYRATLHTVFITDENERLDELAQINGQTPLELIATIASHDDNIQIGREPVEETEEGIKRWRLIAAMHEYPITDEEIAQLYDVTFH